MTTPTFKMKRNESEADEEITSLVSEAQKKFGGDILLPTDETMSLLQVDDWIPMPEPLARVMSAPGIPCGLVMEVMGKKDSGKTTFATQALIECQKIGGIAMLLDTENKFSLKRAANMGLNVKRLVIVKAETLEQAFDKFQDMVKLIKQRAPDRTVLCVWDSLGQTPSNAEMDDDVKEFSMAAAKVIKGRLRRLVTYISKTKVAFVIINQVYANMSSFGKKTTPYGGSGPEYAASIQLETVKKGRLRPKGKKSPDDFAGTAIEIECIKNHIGQPFKKVEIGVDWRGFAIDRDVEYAPE